MPRFVTLVLSAALIAGAPLAAAQSDGQAEMMLREAMHAELSDGDLQRAIELYRTIVERHGDARPVAAQALLRMGMSYEKLGMREAQAVYQELLSDYGDQAEPAARARDRLTTLSPDVTTDEEGLIARRLLQVRIDWIRPGAVSPDGREIAFIQWDNLIPGSGNSGDLGVARVGSDDVRIVGRTSPFDGLGSGTDTYVVGAAWSRDGERLVYSEWAETWDHHVLHVVNADGSGHRVVSDNLQNVEIHPYAFSSDGRWIVALVRGWDDVFRIATFSLENGSVTVLKTLRTGLSGHEDMTLSLSPDDRFVAYAYSPSSRDEPDVRVLAVDGSGETVIAPNASTDLNPLWTPDGSRLVFLSDRSGSADLWAVEMSEGRARDEAFVVRPHVGPIVPLGFTADGALTYRAEVSDSNLRIVSLEPGMALVGHGEQLTGRFVGYNSRAAWSPDGARLAYLSTRPGPGLDTRNYLVVKSLPDGGERDIELTMALNRDTRPAWSEDGDAVFLQAFEVERTETGATRHRAGYRIDVESGEVRREPYIRDWAGFWRTNQARFVSERQSNRLRSLGVRISGQRDISAYTRDDEPLRPGESLLWVRTGIRWVRAIGCEAASSFPSALCLEDDVIRVLYEQVVDAPQQAMRGWELSPDGSRLAYLLPDPEGVWNVWVRSVTMEGEPTLLHSHSDVPGCGCVIRWTPDGRHLIYGFDAQANAVEADDLANVYRIDVDGGEPEALDWPITRAQLGDLAFDPSGGRAVLRVGNTVPRTEVWALSGFPWDGGDVGRD
jgi:Tol biopolymer transport system component